MTRVPPRPEWIERPDPDLAAHCGFCDRGVREVGKMIAGVSTFICDRCVKHCAAIVILGKDRVFDNADIKRARAEGRTSAFAEMVTLMDACEAERQPAPSLFGSLAARLRKAGGLRDG